MQQVISHTYLSTYRSTLIRSCVILSHPGFLRVGRLFMNVVSWLCIRQLPVMDAILMQTMWGYFWREWWLTCWRILWRGCMGVSWLGPRQWCGSKWGMRAASDARTPTLIHPGPPFSNAHLLNFGRLGKQGDTVGSLRQPDGEKQLCFFKLGKVPLKLQLN